MNANPNLDGLERFVAEHREEFDYLEPDPKLWERVEAKLSGVQRPLMQRIPAGVWQLAASIVLVVGAYLILDRPVPTEALGSVEVTPLESEFRRVAPELAKTDAEFGVAIHKKVDFLAQYEHLDPQLVAEFRGELATLDSMNIVLKQELLDNPEQEALAEALRLNLQLQLNLINQQLGVLKELKATRTSADQDDTSAL